MDPIWKWIVLIVLAISTFGTLLPVVPGLPVAAAAVIIYGWLEGFRQVDAVLILVTILLTVAGTLLDYFSGPYTGRQQERHLGRNDRRCPGAYLLGTFRFDCRTPDRSCTGRTPGRKGISGGCQNRDSITSRYYGRKCFEVFVRDYYYCIFLSKSLLRMDPGVLLTRNKVLRIII